MKQVLIFIAVLFLGIFGAKFYIDHKREVDTKEAKVVYDKLIRERLAKGDALDRGQYLAEIGASKLDNAVEVKGFKTYLEGKNGFQFNCQRLEKKARFGKKGAKKLFNTNVGQFGPLLLNRWKALLNPRIVTNPSNRLLASKVLRNFEAWETPLDTISFALLDTLNSDEGGLLGLHALRSLEPEVKERYFKRMVEYTKALAVIGRLQFYKGDRSKPYDAASDMIRLCDAFALEAILDDEIKMSDKLDTVMADYIEFLAMNGATGKFVSQIQASLAESSMSKVILQRIRLKRMSTKAPLEKSLAGLVGRERDSLSIFDSGFVLTDLEKWKILKIYTQAGVILNYTEEGELRRIFNQSVIRDFGNYITDEKVPLELNHDAELAFNRELKKLESEIYDAVKKQTLRDEAIVKLAISVYKKRVGKYPNSLDQLAAQDIVRLPVHPLTGKPYNYEYVTQPKEAIMKNHKGKEPFPRVSFKTSFQSVIKKTSIKD